MQQAKKMRATMQVADIKKNIFLIHRWEYLKERKTEQEAKVQLKIDI
jgi:hypothetical protein